MTTISADLSEAPAADAPIERYDVIIAADMTLPGDRGFRIALEARHHVAAGRRVGLLQIVRPKPNDRIAPEIQSCVRRNLAAVVATAAGLIETTLMVIHGPSEANWSDRPLSQIRSERTVLVCHRARDFTVTRLKERLKGAASLEWAACSSSLRTVAPAGLKVAAQDWLLMPDDTAFWSSVRKRRRSKPHVGWLALDESIPPVEPEATTVVTRLDAQSLLNYSLDRLLALDGLAYFPVPGEEGLADALVFSALRARIPVALPEHLRSHYGDRGLYCEPRDALSLIAKAGLGPKGMPQPVRRGAAVRGEHEARPRPVMFVASNGVGVGHLSRLLAIARRIDQQIPIVFVTQAQAVNAAERLGYRTEYIPSSTYVGGDVAEWDEWFRYELETLVGSYDPQVVVYDGNNPPHGLIGAIAPRADCRLAWVRRGLWGKLTSPFIENSRWFDLIIEPGELQGQADEGVTARRRDEALLVPPIRLLDEDEVLPREEAASALGLDPARPAALIQLGAGYNRDIVSLLDQLVTTMRQAPQLQICIAEWVNGTQPINYWPDVTYLRGYPLCQYYRAFDFSIAAAGYNTFHDVIALALPTIFIPNRHPTMDDQAGRASHAQNLHAAFELDENDLDDLPELIALMMNIKAREFLVTHCRGLRQENGAPIAARALTELLEVIN